MNLLKEGLDKKVVIPTEITRKLIIDGSNKVFPVYRIRLDQLYYNDQNTRIATWISEYKSRNNGMGPDRSDIDNFNKVIESFIVESNPDAIRKTQANIELLDQREPGVVLADGRIIDGNRRFTCLRRLSSKNERFNWFEAVILDRELEKNAKQLKMLELSIQLGEESKVDYSPIERLVGLYDAIEGSNILTVSEYARSVEESEAEVRRLLSLAELMVEFLEFINAPKQFHIARDLQVYYPLEELSKIVKKTKSEEEAANYKNIVFTNIVMGVKKDMTRVIRDIQNIQKSPSQAEFVEEQLELVEEVLEALPEPGKVDESYIRDVLRAEGDLQNRLEDSRDKALTKAKKIETRKRPLSILEKATIQLETLDLNIVKRLNQEEKFGIKEQLDVLIDLIQKIEEAVE